MPQTPEASWAQGQTRVKTILVVEDDVATGEFLIQAISLETPYLPVLAQTRTRALEVLEQIKPDLFILDYYLTPGNGLELYDTLHAQPGLESVPAIILSASLDQHLPAIASRHLMGLAKPLELDELLETIESVLTRALSPSHLGE